MKTAQIPESLLIRICTHFCTMEPPRDSLVDDCLESLIYDELVKLYPQFMDCDELGFATYDEAVQHILGKA